VIPKVLRQPRKAAAPLHPKTKALYQHIGRAVRAAREALGLTQEELAATVGVARTSITNLEQGKQHFPLHHLLTVADALGGDLLGLIPSSSILESANPTPVVRRGVIVRGAPRADRVAAALLS
jgi:y4mF family transcriptional regulator